MYVCHIQGLTLIYLNIMYLWTNCFLMWLWTARLLRWSWASKAASISHTRLFVTLPLYNRGSDATVYRGRAVIAPSRPHPQVSSLLTQTHYSFTYHGRRFPLAIIASTAVTVTTETLCSIIQAGLRAICVIFKTVYLSAKRGVELSQNIVLIWKA